jgi:hypothetical protein
LGVVRVSVDLTSFAVADGQAVTGPQIKVSDMNFYEGGAGVVENRLCSVAGFVVDSQLMEDHLSGRGPARSRRDHFEHCWTAARRAATPLDHNPVFTCVLGEDAGECECPGVASQGALSSHNGNTIV